MSSNTGGRRRSRVIATLRTIRLVGTAAALVTVVAGAFGFGPEAQLTGAALGALVAGLLKGSHIVA